LYFNIYFPTLIHDFTDTIIHLMIRLTCCH